jgi:hypothetical protein
MQLSCYLHACPMSSGVKGASTLSNGGYFGLETLCKLWRREGFLPLPTIVPRFPGMSTHSLVTIFQAIVSCWLQCNAIPRVIIISPDSWNCPRLHHGTRQCELSRWRILTCTVREIRIYYSPGRRVITGRPWNYRLSKLELFQTNSEYSAFVPIWQVFIFSEG